MTVCKALVSVQLDQISFKLESGTIPKEAVDTVPPNRHSQNVAGIRAQLGWIRALRPIGEDWIGRMRRRACPI